MQLHASWLKRKTHQQAQITSSQEKRKCNTQQISVYTATQVTRSPESLPSDPKLIFMKIAQEFSLQQSLREPKANKRPGKGSSGEKMRIRIEQPRRVTLRGWIRKDENKRPYSSWETKPHPRFQKFELVVDTGPANAYFMIRRHTREKGVRSEIYVTDGLTLSTPRSPVGIDAL